MRALYVSPFTDVMPESFLFLTLILTFSIKVKNIGSHIDLGKTLKFTA